MSGHGHRRPGAEPSQDGPASPGSTQFGWALAVIAAALIGGLAAAALVHASLVVAVVVSVVIGAIGVLVLLRSPARTAPHPATMPRAQPPRAAPPPESYPPDPVAPATPAPSSAGPGNPGPDGLNRGGAPAVNETVVQLMPLTPPGSAGPADAPWWDSAQGKPAPSAGAKRAPAPDLSTYLGSTFIAQCPRCGAFRLDIRRTRSAWDFRCEVCEYTWSWQPGTPWPPVRVMPP